MKTVIPQTAQQATPARSNRRSWFGAAAMLATVLGLSVGRLSAGSGGGGGTPANPSLTLTGTPEGNRVRLQWTISGWPQRYYSVYRDGRKQLNTSETSVVLDMPDWNVHRYSVRAYHPGWQGLYLEQFVDVGPVAGVLPVPRPVYPLAGDVVRRTTTLRVDAVPGATHYRFEVRDAASGKLIERGDAPRPSYALNLPANRRLRWRAAVVSVNLNKTPATVGTFTEQIPFSTGTR